MQQRILGDMLCQLSRTFRNHLCSDSSELAHRLPAGMGTRPAVAGAMAAAGQMLELYPANEPKPTTLENLF